MENSSIQEVYGELRPQISASARHSARR